MSKKSLAQIILLLVALGPAALAADRYLIRVPTSKIGDVVARHGLILIRSLQGSATGLHVVQAPQGMDSRQIAADSSVQAVEEDGNVLLPEAAPGFQGHASAQVNGLGAPTVVSFFGVQALGSYVNQPAGAVIALAGARAIATGAGTVAIIDTGVDPNHPVLKNSLVPDTILRAIFRVARRWPIWINPPRPFWTTCNPPRPFWIRPGCWF